MIEELSKIENVIFKPKNLKISNFVKDNESEDYLGYDFKIDYLNIKFRKAKITPKKIGQFVALWKRNAEKQTEPFNITDKYDFYIIVTEQNKNFGFFLFSKSILNEKQILTDSQKEGKRGFRVYPEWDIPENKQAEKTQKWQTEYFIDFNNSEAESIEKYNKIFTLK